MKNQELQNLLFRRQFLLAKNKFPISKNWQYFSLNDGYILSVHPDLEHHIKRRNSRVLALLGIGFDVEYSGLSGNNLLESILDEAKNFQDILSQTTTISGRWVIIYQDQTDTYVFNDPSGYRTIYYHKNLSIMACGSQPEIIKAILNLSYQDKEDVTEFIYSERRRKRESYWVGDQTIYQSCYRLLPNHYLRFSDQKAVRFFPDPHSLEEKSINIVIPRIIEILNHTYQYLAGHYSLSQAVTAGIDSRLLLAASRPFAKEIDYFVDRMGVLPFTDPDIWVPALLSQRINTHFKVLNSNDKLPDWFINLLVKNVTEARLLPKTKAIYHRLVTNEQRILINGNTSDLSRVAYNPKKHTKENIDAYFLARWLNYHDIDFVIDTFEEWMNALYKHGLYQEDIINLVYWEQRLGIWGAQYASENDIATEEIRPINCRYLLYLILSTPTKYRIRPDFILYRQLIKELWPDCLSLPVNPFYNLRKFIGKGRGVIKRTFGSNK